jgi:hypothetical protein
MAMNFSRGFSGQQEADISDQFQGVEIEFNDKVTLFPVQVERAHTSTNSGDSHSRDREHRDDWR